MRIKLGEVTLPQHATTNSDVHQHTIAGQLEYNHASANIAVSTCTAWARTSFLGIVATLSCFILRGDSAARLRFSNLLGRSSVTTPSDGHMYQDKTCA